MKTYVSDQHVKDFIENHKNLSLPELALKLHSHPNLPKEYILNQVNGLQKLKSKLPDWQHYTGILFPAKVSFEQCSSTETASYKLNFIKDGDSVVDFTGGFGVDTVHFAKKASSVSYIERNSDLCMLFRHNQVILGVPHVEVYCQDSLQWLLEHSAERYGLVYVDPARRGANNQKLFKIEDCEPNIIALFPLLAKVSQRLLVKFSPMVDLSVIRRQLPVGLKEIHVVSVKNECKEVLAYFDHEYVGNVSLVLIDVKVSGISRFACVWEEDPAGAVTYAEPQKYLYEPNASIMKAQCFKALSGQLKLAKLSQNSHLYTSDEPFDDFPGRTFRVMDTCEYSDKAVKSKLGIGKAHITVRNFGESADEVRARLKLKDGGDIYIFATSTVLKKKLLIICEAL